MTVKVQYGWDEVEELLVDATSPTSDDVSVARDGQRLDSAQAVRDFFDEIRLNSGSHERAS